MKRKDRGEPQRDPSSAWGRVHPSFETAPCLVREFTWKTDSLAHTLRTSKPTCKERWVRVPDGVRTVEIQACKVLEKAKIAGGEKSNSQVRMTAPDPEKIWVCLRAQFLAVRISSSLWASVLRMQNRDADRPWPHPKSPVPRSSESKFYCKFGGNPIGYTTCLTWSKAVYSLYLFHWIWIFIHFTIEILLHLIRTCYPRPNCTIYLVNV